MIRVNCDNSGCKFNKKDVCQAKEINIAIIYSEPECVTCQSENK